MYENNRPEDYIVNTFVTPRDPRREERTDYNGRTSLRQLQLKPGKYTIELHLQSQNEPLLGWDTLTNPDVPDLVIFDQEEKSIERILPMWEQNWASIMSPKIEVTPNKTNCFLVPICTHRCRSLHGKINYKNAKDRSIKTVYLDQTFHGDETFREYIKYETPPEGAESVTIKFLAQHRPVFSEKQI